MSMAKRVWHTLAGALSSFYVVVGVGVTMMACCALDASASAEGFVLMEGDFKPYSSSSQQVSNDSIYCTYPAQALNILFMTQPPIANTQGGVQQENVNISSRCLHAAPFRLLAANSSTVHSFSTTFTFAMAPGNSSSGEGIDGLAFIIVPDLVGPPDNSDSGFLGFLNGTSNKRKSSHAFAVELDTFSNREFKDDPGDHVGIDLNSLTSTNSSPAGYYDDGCKGEDPFNPTPLQDGSIQQAWIAYNASTRRVAVTVSPVAGRRPKRPLLETYVDLSGLIREEMYVGFGSSTGALAGFSYVFAWSFSVNAIADPINTEKSFTTKDCSTITKKPKLALILGISIPITLLALLGMAIIGGCYLRRMKQNLVKQFHDLIELENLDYRPRKYSYKELSAATGGFSSSQVLGRGGFGSVYKGILSGGGGAGGRSGPSPMIVAVKRIAPGGPQGTIQDSMAEVEIIGRLHHRNLVQLLGWCREKDELLLVYEYMVNGSLDQWLFKGRTSTNSNCNSNSSTNTTSTSGADGGVDNGSWKDDGGLSWSKRHHILCGVAAALGYLHEEWKQVVVHRDVKASNVLLDSEFNGKLGDFGLARLHEHKQQEFQTNKVAGTLGYLAPEARGRGRFTDKSDVYSFGALALEMACGRRPVDVKKPNEEIILVTWVWDLYEHDKILHAIDDTLLPLGINAVDEKSKSEMEAVLQIGILCSHPDPDVRPTMRQVVQMLKGEVPVLPIAALPRRSKSRVPSFSFSLSEHYIWADHSVELGMIENSEEIKLIPQSQNSTSFSKEPSFSFVL